MNKFLFKLHSWTALLAVIPLLVICLTGSLLVFKHEIDRLLMYDNVVVPDNSSQRLPMDDLLARINTQYTEHQVTGWLFHNDPQRADLVYLIANGTDTWTYLLLDGYTGTVLAEPVPLDHYITDWLLELHYTLLLGDAGLLVAGLFSIGLLILGISGIILHRKFWKNFFTLRWNKRLVIYFSDLHKIVGVIASPVLLILGFTGSWWNIDNFIHELQEHADGHTHYLMTERLYNEQLSIDELLKTSSRELDGFTTNYLSLPWEPGAAITAWGTVPSNNPLSSRYSSTVSFNSQTGELIGTTDIRNTGIGPAIVDSFEELHYGTFGGLTTRVLWAILGLAPLILSVTGITLWFKRSRKRRLKRQKNLAQLPG